MGAIILKVTVFTAIFAVLHEVMMASEAVFEHMKAGFIGWMIVGIGYRAIVDRAPLRDFTALATGAATVPWFLTVFWYVSAAVLGHRIPSLPLHIVYSFVITFLGGWAAASLEEVVRRGLPVTERAWLFSATITALVVIQVFIAIAFSNQPPYIDVFEVP